MNIRRLERFERKRKSNIIIGEKDNVYRFFLTIIIFLYVLKS